MSKISGLIPEILGPCGTGCMDYALYTGGTVPQNRGPGGHFRFSS